MQSTSLSGGKLQRLQIAAASCVFLFCLSSASHAADIAPAAYSWTGFYAGLNAGAAFGGADMNNRVTDAFLTSAFADEYKSQYQRSMNASDTGFSAGAELGYNWQVSNLLLGVETDFNYAGLQASQKRVYDVTDPQIFSEDQRFSSEVNWFGTARVRIGFLASDQLLIYGTGGLAYGNVDASFHQTESSSYDWKGSDSSTRLGWTLGGGAEYAFDNNWSVGAEYLYVDLGSFDFNAPNVGTSSDQDYNMKANVSTSFSVARATIKYRF